jgi:hypothetical protein
VRNLQLQLRLRLQLQLLVHSKWRYKAGCEWRLQVGGGSDGVEIRQSQRPFQCLFHISWCTLLDKAR